MHLMDGLTRPALSMYNKMLAENDGHIFPQRELSEVTGISDPMKLMGLIQENMNMGFIKMIRRGDDLCYQVVKKEDVEKIQTMTKDEAMVYSYIEASGTDGIWTKTIKSKTNLHQTVVQRCLKSLEGKRYIKNIKSVKYPTRKIYMLATLQPSVEVTGGPWFTDSELDSEFISSLLTIIYRYILSESFPSEDDRRKPQRPPKSRNKRASAKEPIVYDQLSYPGNYKGYLTLDQIHNFVHTSGITTVELATADIKALLDVLLYDEKIETLDHGVTYKAVLGTSDEAETTVVSDYDCVWSFGPFL
ncbi:RNA polymerase Rpc34 [Lipomyces arxii]|uniref:RNA polymerase Rpc34 n=1 Tax=Lipomyces arxii TaxID=56418 RepID=UPI0034CD9A2E